MFSYLEELRQDLSDLLSTGQITESAYSFLVEKIDNFFVQETTDLED